MKKLVAFSSLLMVFFAFSFPLFAQETFTLTTYYPAPFGIYQRIVTQTLGVGDNNLDVAGIDATDAPDPATDPGNVWIAGRLGIGTTNLVGTLTAYDSTAQGAIHIAGAGDSAGGTFSALYLDDNDTNFTNRNTWVVSHKQDAGQVSEDDFHIARRTSADGDRLDLAIDSRTGNIGIGTADPRAALEIGRGYFLPPRHDSDPTTANSVEGMVYYSTNAKQLRVFDGTSWKNVGGGVQMASGIFTGDGSGWRKITTGFTPKIVMLLPHGQGPKAWSDNLIIKMDSWPTSGKLVNPGSFPDCGECYWTAEYIKDAEGYDNPSCTNRDCNIGVEFGIKILTDGFKTNINTARRSYSWIAFSY